MAGTQVMQTKAFKVGSVQRGTVLQLLLCHCFIFTVAIIFGANTLSILCACLLSFLLMLNIPYNLHLLEITLDRLARSLPVEPIPLRLRWPLMGLFVRVNTLGKQSGLQVQMEQRNVAYRDQLLQQVGKTAAQEERNRLARDLHDSIKQQLFSIVVSAAAVKARWEHNPSSAYKIVDDIERTAQEAQVEMQALLQQLRPTALENVGLIESLRMQCQALGYRTGAEVTAELGYLPPDELLPIGAQEMVFRIVQEGFANIARHARASHVWLSLRRQRDALLVEIGDDGQGFDLAQANERPHTYDGMGLSNVRERIAALGGTIAIWSLPGKGTTLHLCIPLVQPHAHEQERANQELATAVHKTRRILRTGIWAAELAAILMLLYTPAFIALAQINSFPGNYDTPVDPQSGGGLAVDYQSFATAYAKDSGTALSPNSVWLRTSDDASSLAHIRSTLPDLQDRRLLTTANQENSVHIDIIGVLAIGVGAALLLALIGTLLSSWLNASNRLTSFAVMRALGMAPRQVAAILLWEHGFVYLLAFLLGTGLGAILTIFAAPAVSLLDLTGPSSLYNPYDVPPVQMVIPYLQLSLLLGGLVIICMLALLLMARIVSRPSIGQTLRLNED